MEQIFGKEAKEKIEEIPFREGIYIKEQIRTKLIFFPYFAQHVTKVLTCLPSINNTSKEELLLSRKLETT